MLTPQELAAMDAAVSAPADAPGPVNPRTGLPVGRTAQVYGVTHRITVEQKHQYTHERLIDLILLNPTVTNKELGAHFGVSATHIGFLRSSDAFQVKLANRQGTDIQPMVREELEARMRSVANRSLELLAEKLDRPAQDIPDNLVLKAVELGAKGVGLGGYGNAVAPPTAPAPDRLERLAERLTALMPGPSKEGAVDVEVREVREAPTR